METFALIVGLPVLGALVFWLAGKGRHEEGAQPIVLAAGAYVVTFLAPTGLFETVTREAAQTAIESLGFRLTSLAIDAASKNRWRAEATHPGGVLSSVGVFVLNGQVLHYALESLVVASPARPA